MGTYYDASPSFMTLLRFRTQFDRSYLDGQHDGDDLVRLVYAGIAGEKPDFYTFLDSARADDTFAAAALPLHLHGQGLAEGLAGALYST